jgi:hypothetical protein
VVHRALGGELEVSSANSSFEGFFAFDDEFDDWDWTGPWSRHSAGKTKPTKTPSKTTAKAPAKAPAKTPAALAPSKVAAITPALETPAPSSFSNDDDDDDDSIEDLLNDDTYANRNKRKSPSAAATTTTTTTTTTTAPAVAAAAAVSSTRFTNPGFSTKNWTTIAPASHLVLASKISDETVDSLSKLFPDLARALQSVKTAATE